jgi:hypothetical protein
MTLGKIWSEIVKRNHLTEKEIEAIAAWALRVYFNENNSGKVWYRDGVTLDTVLDEFVLVDSPISPAALMEVWKALPALHRAIGTLTEEDLDSVATYLQRDQSDSGVPKYTQGDVTLKEMAVSLGGITGTMVNKIFISGAEKLRRLTGGVSPMDMEPAAYDAMIAFIEEKQYKAANDFASSLLAHKEDIKGFLDYQVKLLHLTEIERAAVREDEMQGLSVIAAMTYPEIVDILLTDLEENENLFLTFQNAASKAVFPRRSGRPKGSGKKSVAVEVAEEFDEEGSAPEASDYQEAMPDLG